MRRRVAQHAERVGILLGEDAERPALPQRRHEVLELAIDAHGDRGTEQPLPDRRDHVARQRSRRHVSLGAVGQRERELLSRSVDHCV